MKNCTIYQKQIESWGAKREQKKKVYHNTPPPLQNLFNMVYISWILFIWINRVNSKYVSNH